MTIIILKAVEFLEIYLTINMKKNVMFLTDVK